VTRVAQAAEHAAAEARAVADDNARAILVFISGATGTNAARINGFYEPTQEKGLDGHVLYCKRGDGSMCMEHVEGTWIVKTVSSKGTASGFAWVAGNCAPDACTLRQWTLYDGTSWINVPGVKMATGAETELKVNGCCLRTHDNILPSPRGFLNSLL
jgi:hypothetical protein